MNTSYNFDELITGTLSDRHILTLCKKGKLISGNFNDQNIKQACYELCASNIYWDLSEEEENRKKKLNSGEYILIKPKQLLVIITHETLCLPPNILGRILTKGKLFSIGLLPVNTYADPGFEGNLGIVFFNLSNNYLKIYPGESIAKIEFSKLQHAVLETYRGQHGYQTKIWPIPSDMILTKEEKNNDSRIKSIQGELKDSYGEDIALLTEKVFGYGVYLIYATVAYITFSMILLSVLIYKGYSVSIFSPFAAVILGVVSNIIFALIIHYATSRLRR